MKMGEESLDFFLGIKNFYFFAILLENKFFFDF